jgi:hypothetical protein
MGTDAIAQSTRLMFVVWGRFSVTYTGVIVDILKGLTLATTTILYGKSMKYKHNLGP